MEGDASREELVIKARKPYTITKQRERWTEEEHNRFLEALRLYGRAWQKIEEHIGTKTAVQIRSHAQKFFTKLEKEAHAKGVPVAKALDIDIPPPRPKRKPSTPYPRKTYNGTLTSQDSAKDGNSAATSLHCEKPNGGEGEPMNVKANEDENLTEGFNSLQDAPCSSSVSSANKNSASAVLLANSCTFREFLPLPKEAIKDNGIDKTSNLKRSSCHDNGQPVTSTELHGCNGISATDVQGTQNYPKHVPVHILDGSSVTCTGSLPPNMPSEDSIFRPSEESRNICNGNVCANPSQSANSREHHKEVRSPNYQTPCTFDPGFFAVPHTREANGLFSDLIMSTILQNPVVHAAATYAASFWPYGNGDNHADLSRSFPQGPMNSPPSLAAIAAATVAAATAWWATQGLLPLCTPFNPAVTCWPQPTTTNTGQNPVVKTDQKEPNHQTSSVQDEDSPSKSASFSSSESAESGQKGLQTSQKPDCNGEAAAESGACDTNGANNRKQVDPSSCGSNTPSSDVETDALGKHDEVKEADAGGLAASEPNTRRGKSSNNLGVSEEGRLAFHALFSRDVLPQSFSPPQAAKEEANRNANNARAMNHIFKEKDGDVLSLDLNSNTQSTSSDQQEEKKITLPANHSNAEEGLVAIGLGNERLNTRKTGFKPYKRCSVEAKENGALSTTGNQGGEKLPKRIRLEGEAST